MAKPKFTVGFSATEALLERCKNLFPEGRTQEVLITLLDAYENQSLSSINLVDNKILEESYRSGGRQLEVSQEPSNWASIKLTLNPLVVELLEVTASRLSDRYKCTVDPMQILVEMFTRYTLERWNEWFYPFVMRDYEIINIAKQINPKLTTISRIKKHLANDG